MYKYYIPEAKGAMNFSPARHADRSSHGQVVPIARSCAQIRAAAEFIKACEQQIDVSTGSFSI